MDEVPLLELMPGHCLKIAALIFYCALDCLRLWNAKYASA